MLNGLIIAITGQSGTGKSSVGKIYSKMGFTVVDCDIIAAKTLYNPKCINKLTDEFGTDILIDNKIDKKRLTAKAFINAETLQKLNNATHPFIVEEILRISKDTFAKGDEIVFVDGAAIIGQSFEKYCDKIIVVVSEPQKQYKRLMDRDNITIKQAENRISKQLKASEMLKKADYVIYNNFDYQELILQSTDILNTIAQKNKEDTLSRKLDL